MLGSRASPAICWTGREVLDIWGVGVAPESPYGGESFDKRARAVSDAGAEAVAAAVETPWGDRNQRFVMSDGLHLTLFETR